MFEEEVDDRTLNAFRVNKNYEKKFTLRKKREYVDKMKSMHGTNYEAKMGLNEESGSELEEDEEGLLFNNKVRAKFLETLASLKNKRPQIYDEKRNFF